MPNVQSSQIQQEPLFSKIIPPPIGGLNKRDPLHAMPEADAFTLDNWIPQSSYLQIRDASSLFASIGGGSEIVMLQSVYRAASDTEYLLASDNASG